eukprot:572174-Hanusia_phi.AAC.4
MEQTLVPLIVRVLPNSSQARSRATPGIMSSPARGQFARSRRQRPDAAGPGGGRTLLLEAPNIHWQPAAQVSPWPSQALNDLLCPPGRRSPRSPRGVPPSLPPSLPPPSLE